MDQSERRDVYQTVTDSIVGALESAGEWQKPWTSGLVGDRPRNVRGTPYRGVNYLLLSGIRAQHGYPQNVWGTYKAWGEKGGQVRKGEKGSPCVFWKFNRVVSEDAKGERVVKTVPFARLYTVFNLAQVDGVDASRFERVEPATPEGLDELIADVAEYVQREGVRVVHEDPDRAFYSTLTDSINMPPTNSFVSALAYVSTLAHEAVHSTGHTSRLARTFGARFGDDAYAVEELVAELGAAMALAGAGHEYQLQHSAAYIKNWLSVLKNDNRAIFTAASQAEKAADRILHAPAVEVEDEEAGELPAAA